MGYMSEYISRRLKPPDLEKELLSLISEYNKLSSSFMLVYVAAIGKPIPDVALSENDYFLIHDLLRDVDASKVTLYIETPGGSAEAAEEIVECLRSKFKHVSFVVSGEAKSAGTIMVLSADEIFMTETGSLGPIDAQVRIGRYTVSAYDYIEWVNNKREEAEKQGKMNPFDATMVAQISPGEISGVNHALKYAEDLVVGWLIKYKFKNWQTTQTRKVPVTPEMKKNRAMEIASELTNHAKWRSHGRSIKIDDLNSIGLMVHKVEDDPKMSEIVYRIQTICRLLFTTATYKIFATEKEKVFRNATQALSPPSIPSKPPDIVHLDVKCSHCGKVHNLYAKFVDDPKIDQDMKKQGRVAYPKDNKLQCSCGSKIDLSEQRRKIESQIGKKLII